MRDVNELLLGREFKIYDWWGKVAHGLNLLGVCAPITAVVPIRTLFIAATHTRFFEEPWGSHPLIDNNVKWADIRVVHNGYELGRTEKVAYMKSSLQLLSYLRVCYSSLSSYNCEHCEKCLRTIVGLILNGIDPRFCNFNIGTNILQYTKDCFAKGKLHLTKNEVFMWRDIQTSIPDEVTLDIYGSKEFFRWFKEFDISRYKENPVRHFLWDVSHKLRHQRGSLLGIIRRMVLVKRPPLWTAFEYLWITITHKFKDRNLATRDTSQK